MFYTIFKPEDFYKNFDSDYFLFAQELNQFNLENRGAFDAIQKKFIWVEEDSYRLSLMIQIRFQALLCVNTLFELIFNLVPDKNGHLPDKELIIRMNTFQELSALEIANWVNRKESKLNKLLKPIQYKNGEEKDLIYHIFYLGKPITEDLSHSVTNMIEMLKIMAKEIADTSELNSFKHGMRGVIDPRYFKILNKEYSKDLLSFDFKESISYYTHHKKEKCFTVNIKKMDPKRGYNLTVYASLLIKAIINSRKKLFHPNETKEEIISVLISDENLKQIQAYSTPHFSLKFSNCKKSE